MRTSLTTASLFVALALVAFVLSAASARALVKCADGNEHTDLWQDCGTFMGNGVRTSQLAKVPGVPDINLNVIEEMKFVLAQNNSTAPSLWSRAVSATSNFLTKAAPTLSKIPLVGRLVPVVAGGVAAGTGVTVGAVVGTVATAGYTGYEVYKSIEATKGMSLSNTGRAESACGMMGFKEGTNDFNACSKTIAFQLNNDVPASQVKLVSYDDAIEWCSDFRNNYASTIFECVRDYSEYVEAPPVIQPPRAAQTTIESTKVGLADPPPVPAPAFRDNSFLPQDQQQRLQYWQDLRAKNADETQPPLSPQEATLWRSNLAACKSANGGTPCNIFQSELFYSTGKLISANQEMINYCNAMAPENSVLLYDCVNYYEENPSQYYKDNPNASPSSAPAAKPARESSSGGATKPAAGGTANRETITMDELKAEAREACASYSGYPECETDYINAAKAKTSITILDLKVDTNGPSISDVTAPVDRVTQISEVARLEADCAERYPNEGDYWRYLKCVEPGQNGVEPVPVPASQEDINRLTRSESPYAQSAEEMARPGSGELDCSGWAGYLIPMCWGKSKSPSGSNSNTSANGRLQRADTGLPTLQANTQTSGGFYCDPTAPIDPDRPCPTAQSAGWSSLSPYNEPRYNPQQEGNTFQGVPVDFGAGSGEDAPILSKEYWINSQPPVNFERTTNPWDETIDYGAEPDVLETTYEGIQSSANPTRQFSVAVPFSDTLFNQSLAASAFGAFLVPKK